MRRVYKAVPLVVTLLCLLMAACSSALTRGQLQEQLKTLRNNSGCGAYLLVCGPNKAECEQAAAGTTDQRCAAPNFRQQGKILDQLTRTP